MSFIPNLNEIGGLSALLGLATNNLEYDLSEQDLEFWIVRAQAKLAGGAFSSAFEIFTQGGTVIPSPLRLKAFKAAALCIMADRVDGVGWTPTVYGDDGTTVVATPGLGCLYVREANTAWFSVDLHFNVSGAEASLYISMPTNIETVSVDPSNPDTSMVAVVQDGSNPPVAARVTATNGQNKIHLERNDGFSFGNATSVAFQILMKVEDI